MSALEERLADRLTIGAIEIEILLGEIGRSECIDAAPVAAMAIDAVALCVVAEKRFTASCFRSVGALSADLENVFNDVIDLRRRQIFLVTEILGIFLGTVLRVIGQHVEFSRAG